MPGKPSAIVVFTLHLNRHPFQLTGDLARGAAPEHFFIKAGAEPIIEEV